MSREPIRMVDLTDGASSEEHFMRAIIRAERTELPSPAKMQELSARLGPMMTKRSSSAWWASSWRVMLVAGIGIGVVVVALRSGSGVPPGTVDALPVPQRVEDRPAASPLDPAVTASPHGPSMPVVAVESLPSAATPDRARVAPSSDVPACTGEIELLDGADAALRAGDATRALSLTRQHSQRCPGGAFAQEGERIAIEALFRLGRHAEARARARSFEARFPSSPHLHRIRSLVEQHPG